MEEKKKKKKWPMLVGILAVIIIIGAVAGGSSGAKKVGDSTGTGSGDTTASEKGTEQSKFKIGDVVDLNGVQVTLVDVTESTGEQYNTPADGNIFLICEFEINNQSKSDIAVSSMVSFEAYCDDYAINQSLSALVLNNTKNQLDGTVAAGKKMNGVIGYEVSKDWKSLEITYSPSFWGSKSMTFQAKK